MPPRESRRLSWALTRNLLGGRMCSIGLPSSGHQERVGAARVATTGGSAALRRSELVTLDVEHLEFTTARGLLVRIVSSKTDQERAGAGRSDGGGPVRARE